MAVLNSYFVGGEGLTVTYPAIGSIILDESTIMAGLSAPRVVDQTYPGQDGTFWDGAITYEPLEFPIVLTVVPTTLGYRALLIDLLHKMWTNRTSLTQLEYQPVPSTTNPSSTRRSIHVYRSSSVSIRRLNAKDFQYSFMVTAPRPFWFGAISRKVPLPGPVGGDVVASTAPLMDASFYLYGPFSTATVTCTTNGQKFVYSGSCASGDRILVRPYQWAVQKQTSAGAFKSNEVTNLVPAKGLGSIIDVEPGSWQVAFTGSGSGTKAEVEYRDWFL